MGNDGTTAPGARHVRIVGTVRDAETGDAIERFRVMPGSRGGPHTIQHMGHDKAEEFAGGGFDYGLVLERWRAEPIFCVDAEGYLPFLSEVIGENETRREVEVKLRRGKEIEGRVMSASGEAVEGVSVVLASMYESPTIWHAEYSERVAVKGWPWTRTDGAGHFRLPPREWKVKVVAVCEAGEGVATGEELANGGVIRLQPWGRIEGVLMEGDKPVAGASMAIDNVLGRKKDEPSVHYQYELALTGADGRFVFPRVHPYSMWIMQINAKSQRWRDALAYYGRVTVKSGETASVRYGETGRPVTGVVTIPVVGAKYGYAVWDSQIRRVGPPMKLPEEWGSMGQKKKRDWYKQWWEANKERPEVKHGERCGFEIAPDEAGEFRIGVVPAGLYEVSLRVVEKNDKGEARGEEVASGTDYFVVEEAEGGWSSEAQDVGELRPEAISVLREGSQAPETEFERIDGSKGSLADYKGKVVVMDMWATWCGPCKAEMPNVKKLYAKFRGKENFVMLGLSVDEDKKAWKSYVATEGLEWVQGNVGVWHESKVPDVWGVHGIPAMFVIDKTGKVIYKGWAGPPMEDAITQSLTSP